MGNDNDRRALLAIVLSLAVYYLWMSVVMPPQGNMMEGQSLDQAMADLEAEDVAVQATPAAPAATAVVPAPEPPKKQVVPERSSSFGTTAWEGQVHSKEGALRLTDLTGYSSPVEARPLWRWLLENFTGDPDPWKPYHGDRGPERILGESGAFALAGSGGLSVGEPALLDISDQQIGATHHEVTGLRVIKRYEKGSDPHTMNVVVHFENQGVTTLPDTWIGVVDHMEGDAGRFTNTLSPIAAVDGGVEHLMELSDVEGNERIVNDGTVNWLGVADRYFMAVLMPSDDIWNEVVFDTLTDGRVGAFLRDPTPLDPGDERTYQFTAYLGPKELNVLQRYGNHLDAAVEFGWFGFFAKILLILLKTFQKLVVNWGVAIVLLTVVVKALFYPLTQKAFVSGKRMQQLQPKLKEVKEKYKDNKEMQTQETMKLFQENKVNPMGGCLPSLIQLPVWIALYNVLLYSVELYDSSFLYLQDLTAVDPTGVLPTAVAGLMILQQKLTPMTGMDPAQQKMMRLMPVVFAVFMYSFPSGLVLYISVNSGLTIVQQWLIHKNYSEEPALA